MLTRLILVCSYNGTLFSSGCTLLYILLLVLYLIQILLLALYLGVPLAALAPLFVTIVPLVAGVGSKEDAMTLSDILFHFFRDIHRALQHMYLIDVFRV